MKFDSLIDGMRDDIVLSTQRTIRNKSVKAEAVSNYPFGVDIHNCFIDFLKNAEELGFKTVNVDNYSGHIEMGDGEEIVGILAHLDVVPEGDYWTYPPYEAEIHDGKIYGRGTIDDKGPAICALYAMKALKDAGITPNKRIRLIVGLDEESGSKGIEYYLTKEPNPDVGFTPDADFPVIHGEKGIMNIDMIQNLDNVDKSGLHLINISGGNKSNMVPDYCEAQISKDVDIKTAIAGYENQELQDISYEETADSYIVKIKGVSAHGSTPEKGINAISHMIDFLSTLPLANDDVFNFIKFYRETINTEVNGQHIGCELSDDESGLLVFNAGVINMNDKEIQLECNLRYPVTAEDTTVVSGIKNVTDKHSIKMDVLVQVDPLYISKDDELVKQLINAYSEYIPGNHEPITIGGGTYARSCKNILAFGPMLPGSEELAHQKDEHISIEDLVTITKIYAKAIYLLSL